MISAESRKPGFICISRFLLYHYNTTRPPYTTKTKNHQGPLNFSKNIVSLVHHGAYCALMVHIAPSWCTSTPYTVVVVYSVPWVNPHRDTHRHTNKHFQIMFGKAQRSLMTQPMYTCNMVLKGITNWKPIDRIRSISWHTDKQLGLLMTLLQAGEHRQADKRTDRRTDVRTLPSTLSPSLHGDNKEKTQGYEKIIRCEITFNKKLS